MFERFTPDAKAVLVRAQAEAKARHHNFLGTEHLLLGLLGVTNGPLPAIFAQAGVDRANVGAAIDEIIGGRVPRPMPSDQDALATIGIDLSEVHARLRDEFGDEAFRQALAKAPPRSGQPFTPRSKKVLELTLREALATPLNDNEVRPEHLLLGLLREGKGVGAVVLAQLAPAVDFRRTLLESLGVAPT